MKMRRTILNQVYPAYVLAIVISLTVLAFTADRVFRQALYGEKEKELETIATLAVNVLVRTGYPVQQDLELFRQGTSERLTIIAPDGTVIAETHRDPAGMVNHRDRPEVQAALRGERGIAIRQSSTTGARTLYLALPFSIDEAARDEAASYETTGDDSGEAAGDDSSEAAGSGAAFGVIRVATSVEALDRIQRETLIALVMTAVLILIATVVTMVLIVNRVYRPLFVIREAAQKYSRGDLTHRVKINTPEEMADVAGTMNGMAERLSEMITGLRDRRNELEAVLASMVEGVIVVDADRRIRSMNAASQRLFEKEGIDFQGRSLIDHVRNSDLDQFAGLVLNTEEYAEQTITLYRSAPTYIQVHGTLLRQGEERETRVLLVLNDITRLKQLEAVRRDFVANVSHELKTPVTAILGFVETLRDGIPEDPDQATRFLEIISAHANRLNLIIEDLLTLSRLESAESGIERAECALDMIVRRVLETCEDQVSRKGIQIHVQQEGSRLAQVNENLLEQAMVNLVNNAVKYSENGTVVEITVRNTPVQLIVKVSDQGQGIPAGDVPRIFERFFRVDRARSRELGGTGLGLAIVKHIALAHGGEVTVESVEGEGSTFRLAIPQETNKIPSAG